MNRALATLVALVSLCLPALPSAAQAADDPEIVFNPPLSVNIRQTNGVAARGEILSMNDKDLLLRSVSGKEVRIKLERIRSIKTSNETFEYWPGDETFSDLCARVDKVPGAKLMGDDKQSQTGRSPRRVVPRDETDEIDPGDQRGRAKPQPPVSLPSGSDILKPGRPGVNIGSAGDEDDDDRRSRHQSIERAGPRGRPVKDGVSDADERESEQTADEPQPGSVIYTCSHCQKELPLSFRSGDACPHCGKVAVLEEESAASAAVAPPRPVQNPFAAGGQAATQAQAPAVVPVQAAPAAAPAATGGGMGLADVPLIAKVGVFAAFLVVGWFLLNRR